MTYRHIAFSRSELACLQPHLAASLPGIRKVIGFAKMRKSLKMEERVELGVFDYAPNRIRAVPHRFLHRVAAASTQKSSLA